MLSLTMKAKIKTSSPSMTGNDLSFYEKGMNTSENGGGH